MNVPDRRAQRSREPGISSRSSVAEENASRIGEGDVFVVFVVASGAAARAIVFAEQRADQAAFPIATARIAGRAGGLAPLLRITVVSRCPLPRG